jgi:polar amino acid transport system substrate-binding protein
MQMFISVAHQWKARSAIKYIGCFAAVALFIGALCGMAIGRDYPPDIRRIMDRGKLIVAIYHGDLPPFFMRDSEGRLYGVDIKLAEGIASKLGVKVEFDCRSTTFNEVVDKVARHEVDLGMGSLSCTLERAKRVSFTKPYIILRQGLLVNRVRAAKHKLESKIANIARIPGIEIAVEGGTSYVDTVRELFPRAAFREMPDFEGVVDAVLKGEVVAAFLNEVDIRRLIAARPEVAMYLQTFLLQCFGKIALLGSVNPHGI